MKTLTFCPSKCKLYLYFLLAFLLLFIKMDNTCSGQKMQQKAVMIIAGSDFRDEEFLQPKDMLETNRIAVTVAASSRSPSRGMLGTVVRPDIRVSDVKVEDYDAIIFVGGGGAKEYWDDAAAHRIAVQAAEAEKIIGAICIAPVTLARAGILKGRNATVWPGVAKKLEGYEVNYTAEKLEVDGNIITASGPKQAQKFGEALVKALVRRR
jgi:protease I